MGRMSKNLQIFFKITILCLLKMQVPHHPFKYVARCFHGRSSYAGTPGHWMQILMEIWDSLLLLLFSHLVVSDSVAPWTAACQASLPLIISQSFSKLMSIALVMPSSHLVLCRHLLLLPSIFPSIRDFSSECLFTSGNQNTGVSASASVLPVNIQGRSPLRLTKDFTTCKLECFGR